MTDFRFEVRRNIINRLSIGRTELLVFAAAFTMLLSLAYAFTGTEPAKGSEHRDKKDDLTTVASAGNDVEGESVTGENEASGRSLPQTGVEVDRPLLLGLVLLLDGALVLMLTQRRQLQSFSPS